MDETLNWEIREVPVGSILTSYVFRVGNEKPEIFVSIEGVLGSLLGTITYRDPEIDLDVLERIMKWTVFKLERTRRANSKLMYGEGVLDDGQVAATEGTWVREMDSPEVQEIVS